MAREALGVALAVHTFVVSSGIFGNILQMFGPWQLLQHLDRRDNVVVDDVEVATTAFIAKAVTVVVVVAGSIENSADDAGLTIFPALSLSVT